MQFSHFKFIKIVWDHELLPFGWDHWYCRMLWNVWKAFPVQKITVLRKNQGNKNNSLGFILTKYVMFTLPSHKQTLKVMNYYHQTDNTDIEE